jgi:dCMP deaminase
MRGTSTLSGKWIDKYFKLAEQVSSWSKDPSTKVGAIAVGAKGQILSQGYNGFPRGIEDSEARLSDRGQKYKFVVHAEQNCIYNATLNGVSLSDADMYIWGLPLCSECAKGVIQVGVKRVFMCYPSEIPSKWSDSFELTAAMLNEAKVEWKCYESSLSSRYEPVEHSGNDDGR